MAAGTVKGKATQVQFNRYAAAYRNCQVALTKLTTGVSPQACANGTFMCVKLCMILGD